MSGRLWKWICLALMAPAAVQADEVRWRHVATRTERLPTNAAVRTYYKPADCVTPVAQPNKQPESKPPETPAPIRTVKRPLTALIRGESAAKIEPNRELLYREIGAECSRHTREYSVRGDQDGRIIVDVDLLSVAEWNALLARIRELPDLDAHAVIVRGSVP